jgi:hypothetical protein
MPEGDDLYLTIGESIPYVEWAVKAYKIVDGIYNFGKETDTERALRELKDSVAALEQYLRDLDDRLSDLEVRFAQGENRARWRALREHQLDLTGLMRDFESHPEDAADIAFKALSRLRAMWEDDDLWLWTDATRKPEDAPNAWRPMPADFKGVPLPVFAVGGMLWTLAAQTAIADGADRQVYNNSGDEILGWVRTRDDFVPYETPPQSLAERFRAALRVEIVTSTKYRTPGGYCEYAFVGIDDMTRKRTTLRNVDIYFGPDPNAMCTADPRWAEGDEATMEDDNPQLQTLKVVEDAVTWIRQRGTLAEPFVGHFPNWIRVRPTLFGVEPTGILRRYDLDTTTKMTDPVEVIAVGDVAGTGWQNFDEVFATETNVVYAFGDRAVDWYRQNDPARGPSGWAGPRRVRDAPAFPMLGERHEHVNGGNGTFYTVRTATVGFRMERSLEFIKHQDPKNGTGVFGDSNVVAEDWPDYVAVFGGGSGVIYAIDDAGDLFWYRHTGWPNPGGSLQGPIKIGNGWNGFAHVFSIDHGLIAGVRSNGEMLLYLFVQWPDGPGGAAANWRGPVVVPGTAWRGLSRLVPSVGEPPVGGVN